MFELKTAEEGAGNGSPTVGIDRRQLWDYLNRRNWTDKWLAHLGDGSSLRSIDFLNDPSHAYEIQEEFDRRIQTACSVSAYRHPHPSLPCWRDHCRLAWEVVAEMDRVLQERLLARLWRGEDLLEVIYVLPTPPWGHVPPDPLPPEGQPVVRASFPTFAWAINARSLATAIRLDWGPYSTRPSRGSVKKLHVHRVSSLAGAERLDSFLTSIEDCTSGERFGIEQRFEQTGVIVEEALPVASALLVAVPSP